jgi:hypothetical protein
LLEKWKNNDEIKNYCISGDRIDIQTNNNQWIFAGYIDDLLFHDEDYCRQILIHC